MVTDLLGAERAETSGGQLEGERHSVQAAADLPHRRSVVVGEPEPRQSRLAALDEELHCVESAGPDRGARVAFGRQTQRFDLVSNFSRDTQQLTTRGQDLQPFSTLQELLAEPSDRIDQMLAVVEHEQ